MHGILDDGCPTVLVSPDAYMNSKCIKINFSTGVQGLNCTLLLLGPLVEGIFDFHFYCKGISEKIEENCEEDN